MNITLPIISASQKIARGLSLAVAIFMLVACGTPVMKPEQALAIKTVGVVSLLPADLAYQKIGITVFNNERATRPIGDTFNMAARAGAERALKRTGRTVIQLEVDVASLARRVRSAAIIFDSSAEKIQDELTLLVKQHKLDAVVLVYEGFDAENGINGIRMLLRAGLGDVRTVVGRPDVVTLIVDNKLTKLAIQSNSAYFSGIRPGGQPWSYRLDENLDAATHELASSAMQKAIESGVAYDLELMGL